MVVSGRRTRDHLVAADDDVLEQIGRLARLELLVLDEVVPVGDDHSLDAALFQRRQHLLRAGDEGEVPEAGVVEALLDRVGQRLRVWP
eukprot:846961-Prorocentrum_minimum.AAC.1